MADSAAKRKADTALPSPPTKKRNIEPVRSAFTPGLLDNDVVDSYRANYARSGPYPHAVVPKLIEDTLLRNVRDEIKTHIHFTLKETDIYRIHQSGDLANLSGLDSESLKHLPSLVRLRDALYSPDFRAWVSNVTGAGLLSGKKTDMAVNVYTPGSYLLCHDDVIGSRRVSYILYLTDPDKPWQPEWGGGLRLFPTELKKNANGEDIRVPLAEHNLSIPPSFSQLSFFTVLPGESYHDVEEVYHPSSKSSKDEDGGRVRMAISGWFHIPQVGEDGYEEGLEQAQAQRSSLTQLKSAANEFDEPQPNFRHYDEPRIVMNSSATAPEIDPGDATDTDNDILTEQDLTFLLQYISPSFLTPDMTEQFAKSFTNQSMLQLERFFREGFAEELKTYITAADQTECTWNLARPPHKHRFAYLQTSESLHGDTSPVSRILADMIHSHAFKKWLALITGINPAAMLRQDILARRFRRGNDYALASPYTGEQPQLEFTISMTPSLGWERDDTHTDAQDVEKAAASRANGSSNKHINGEANGHTNGEVQVSTSSIPEYGGEEVYMAGDDEDHEVELQTSDQKATENGDGNANQPLPQVGGKAIDPAVYRAANEDEDDGILFTNAPQWNMFSIVLRDKGTLRFVKYVSRAAKGDRWDVKGMVELAEDAFDGEGEEGDDDEEEDDDDDDDEDEEDEAYDSGEAEAAEEEI